MLLCDAIDDDGALGCGVWADGALTSRLLCAIPDHEVCAACASAAAAAAPAVAPKGGCRCSKVSQASFRGSHIRPYATLLGTKMGRGRMRRRAPVADGGDGLATENCLPGLESEACGIQPPRQAPPGVLGRQPCAPPAQVSAVLLPPVTVPAIETVREDPSCDQSGMCRVVNLQWQRRAPGLVLTITVEWCIQLALRWRLSSAGTERWCPSQPGADWALVTATSGDRYSTPCPQPPAQPCRPASHRL